MKNKVIKGNWEQSFYNVPIFSKKNKVVSLVIYCLLAPFLDWLLVVVAGLIIALIVYAEKPVYKLKKKIEKTIFVGHTPVDIVLPIGIFGNGDSNPLWRVDDFNQSGNLHDFLYSFGYLFGFSRKECDEIYLVDNIRYVNKLFRRNAIGIFRYFFHINKYFIAFLGLRVFAKNNFCNTNDEYFKKNKVYNEIAGINLNNVHKEVIKANEVNII